MGEFYEQQYHEQEEPAFNVRDYLQVIIKRKGIILSLFILVFLITVIQTYTAIPYYTASSRVLIEKNEDTRGLNLGIYYGYDPDFLKTQAEIIKSINVARRVVTSLDLATKYRHYFFPAKETAASPLSSVSSAVRNWLSSLTSFFTSDKKQGSKPLSAEEKSSKLDTLALEKTIAVMISGGLSVQPVEETKVVSISFTGRDPAMVAMITNAVVTAYMDEMLEIKMASSGQTIRWMTSKAEEERKKLDQSERTLQQYKRDNDLVTVEDKMAIYPQKLSDLSSQLSKAEAERRELEALVSQIEAAKENFFELENIPVFADSAVLKQLRDNLSKSDQKIKELSKKYGPKHPLMIQAKGELEDLQDESRREVRRIVAATKNAYKLAELKERDVRALIEETKNDILNLNEKFVQYTTLARAAESNRTVYELLENGIKQQNVTEQAQSVNIWVVKEAERPGGPSRPNKPRNLLLGLIFGLAAGLGLAFLIEYLDNTAKSDTELEKRYGLTVLGTVANISKSGENIESHVIDQPLSPLAESYRLIRSGLLLSSAEKPPCVILVTSMAAQEGKTSTVLNLGRVLAQGGKKVLIIDCDLRRPRMHLVAGVINEAGLSSYLSGLTDDDTILPTPEGDLMIFPSGPIPPNPAELLGSRRMEELLLRLRQKFDFVLLDSSPIQSVTDSLALGRIVDGTIVVVRFGKTTYDMLNSGMKKLNDVHVNLLGFVLNGMKKGDSRGYNYGYYSYYKKDEYHK